MPAIEPLLRLIGSTNSPLTKAENILLEAEFFTRLCTELKATYRERYRNYFRVMKFTLEQEEVMLETKFVRLIINDILSTEEYDLKGIAHYTDSYEDVVEELFTGRNESPSAAFLRRLIDLHQSIRRDLYSTIIKKIAKQYLAVAEDT